MRYFILTITLGNDAMQTSNDVADALLQVRTKISGYPDYFESDTSGKIRDANGNTVGTWEVAG